MSGRQHRKEALAFARDLTPRLSLEDVVSAGLPAFYEDHGDKLVYRDGCIFEGAAADAPLGDPILVLDRAAEAVGLEFGWRHRRECTCSFCAGRSSFTAARVMRAREASA